MRAVVVADVGDGLCTSLYTQTNEPIILDCGSRSGSDVAAEGLRRICFGPQCETLLLSHFHSDHYNGFIELATKVNEPQVSLTRLRQVFYPAVPVFPGRERFVFALRLANMLTFGRESGSIAADFIRTLECLTNGRFAYRPVAAGETLHLGSSHFSIVWPPKEATDEISRPLHRVIEIYEKLLEDRPELREFEEYTLKRGSARALISGGKSNEDVNRAKDRIAIEPPWTADNVPDDVRKLNKALRDAANEMCLAFFVDNRLLFLGDLGGKSLGKAVEMVLAAGRRDFEVLIAPHHGTRWHPALSKLRADLTIVSNGHQGNRDFERKFTEMSECVLATYYTGDIAVGGSNDLARDLPWRALRGLRGRWHHY